MHVLGAFPYGVVADWALVMLAATTVGFVPLMLSRRYGTAPVLPRPPMPPNVPGQTSKSLEILAIEREIQDDPTAVLGRLIQRARAVGVPIAAEFRPTMATPADVLTLIEDLEAELGLGEP